MDTNQIVSSSRSRRRRHSAQFKASVIAACQQPGMSMAAIALANGLNANMLRKWVTEAEHRTEAGRLDEALALPEPIVAAAKPAFIQLSESARVEPPLIRVEIQRAGTTISIGWPSSAAPEFGTWLRELLR